MQTKLIVIGAVIITLIGLISTIYVQSAKIDKQDIEIATCQDVNAKNKLSVELLREDAAKNSQLCGERLRIQEEKIKKLKAIDEMKKEIKNENSTEYPLLNALNSMFNTVN